MTPVHTAYLRTASGLGALWSAANRAARRARRDRGDVPGWVLVTLMSALLVVALLAVAQDRLVSLFEQAMDSIG